MSVLILSRIRRPDIGSVALTAIAAAYLLLATNNSFWAHAVRYFGTSKSSLLVFGAALYLTLFSILIPISVKYLMKPALIFFILWVRARRTIDEAENETLACKQPTHPLA
jgi:lipid A ethanolaminephosphotransferase